VFGYFLVDYKITVVYTMVIMSDKTVLNVKIDKELKKQKKKKAVSKKDAKKTATQ